MKKLLNSESKQHEHTHIPIINVQDLTFGYSRRTTEISDLNIEIHRREWTTIIGPNGSGKSTLAKLMVRINKARNGHISLQGRSIGTLHNKEYARNVAYIPQIMDIPEGVSVYDFVSFGRNPWLGFTSRMSSKDHALVRGALERVGAIHLATKMMEHLSGGQRQKVLVALAIAQDTEVIILDEPTTYLDIRAQYEVLELMSKLHEEGKTIVAILHDINQAVQYSDEIIILKDGKLYSHGRPDEVVTEEMLNEVYGIQTKLFIDHNKRKYLTDIKII